MSSTDTTGRYSKCGAEPRSGRNKWGRLRAASNASNGSSGKPAGGPSNAASNGSSGGAVTTRVIVSRLAGHRYAFTGAQVRELAGPIVYVWMRGDVPVYVGRSSCGMTRPLDRNHHALTLEPTDRLLVIPVETAARSIELEDALIRRLQPAKNRPTSTTRLIDKGVAALAETANG